jgi:hypothetical protein
MKNLIENTVEFVKEKLIEIKPKFKDKYHGFSQHIFIDAKDPVLYLNGNKIHKSVQDNNKTMDDLLKDAIKIRDEFINKYKDQSKK